MPGAVTTPKTLYDKVLHDHIVDEREDGTILLYIGQWHAAVVEKRWGIANRSVQIAILSTKSPLQYVDPTRVKVVVLVLTPRSASF